MSNLISALELHTELNAAPFSESGQVSVFDVRSALGDAGYGQQVYLEGHIPGAVYLDLNQVLSGPVQAHGGRHPLPNLETLSHDLRAAGLRQDSPVVVYDDANNLYTGRLWWQLRQLGLTHVQVLDGGIQAWTGAGLELTQSVPQPEIGDFQPRPKPESEISQAELKSKLGQPGVWVLDARAPERYRGEQEPMDAQAGHIPGAVNCPFKANLNPDGLFQSPEQMRDRFVALGLDQAQEIIVYCGSGVSANHLSIALLESGFSEPRLYVGSWSDWSSYPENPIQTGAQP